MVQDSYIPREEVEWEANRQAKLEKNHKKKAKKELKKLNREKRKQYHQKLKQLKAQYKLRVKEYKKNSKSGMSGLDGEIFPQDDSIKNINDIHSIDE